MNSAVDKWTGTMVAILMVAVFFEGAGYSLQMLGMRVRSVQVFEILFLGLLGMFFILGKWRGQKSPLDFWLLAFLASNLIAMVNSQWRARSLKIFLLLVSLVLLYWLVTQLLRTAEVFHLAFFIFLTAGALQVLFGLYQVLAGALNHYRGWNLPIGHLGVVHREYINSVWGRPYGTQVEPDFYGAICMVFALIFIILAFSKNGTAKKWFRAGALFSLLGLYFSFVRAAWLVFLLMLLVLPFLGKKLPFFRFSWRQAMLIVVGAVGIHLLAVHSIPTFKDIHRFRFSTKAPLQATGSRGGAGQNPQIKGFSKKGPRQASGGRGGAVQNSQINSRNIRLFTMRVSLRTWSEHPVIGHGPGSFAYVFWRYVYNEAIARKRIAGGYLPWTNPSMFFSILGDTGLLGLFIFLAMAAKFIFLCRARLGASSAPSDAPAFALAVGLVALLISYLLTNGLWLPMTWVFLALAVASLRHIPAAGGGRAAGAGEA